MTLSVADHVSTLVKLGFSKNQAKVYLTLAFLGTSTAKNIMSVSKVPREEVYRKLDELQKMGFIERTFAKPAVFRANSIKSVLSTLHDMRIEESSRLQIDIAKLVQDYEKRQKIENIQFGKPEIVLIPEKKPFIEKIKKELEQLESSLDLILSWKKGIAGISNNYDLLKRSLNRKIKIRLIIEKNDSKFPRFVEELQENPLFQIKTLENLPIASLAIYDQKRLVINTSEKTSFAESPVLWSNNPSIVGIAKVYFETMWINSK